jgi:phosphoglycolate phosphatase
MPRAVLFDLDGTMLDTLPDLGYALNVALASAHLPQHALPVVRGFIGHGVATLIRRAVPADLRDDHELHDNLRQRFDLAYAEVNGKFAQPYPGVDELLKWLQQQGLPCACVTNKPDRFARDLLRQFDLERYFAVVVGGDSPPRLKPHPDPILLACERLAIAPTQALMIGDSAADHAAARSAGARVLLVAYGYNEGPGVDTLDSDGVLGAMFDATAYIRGT